MRVALVLSHYFPHGGMQRDFLGIARELSSLGHQCTVYCQAWRGDVPAELDVRLLPVPFPFSHLSNHARLRQFAHRLRQALGREEPDAVVGFEKMPGLDICFVPDACFVARAARDHGPVYRLTPRYRHFANWERAVFDPLGKVTILCVSGSQKQEYQARYDTPDIRMHVLPAGLLPDRRLSQLPDERSRAVMRETLGLAADELTLLFVGSAFRTKGLDRAIEAFASLVELHPDTQCRMWIVGADKPDRYRQLIRTRGLADKVTFLGARADVPQLMTAADVMLHPARTEAGGAVLLEALSVGLPVITTANCGHAQHIVKAGAGFVLPVPFEQAALNSALRRATDATWRQDCGQAALSYVQTKDLYSMHATAAQIIDAQLHAGASGENCDG